MNGLIPKISVIVPVYKAEKYLHRCVDSLLAQTFSDFEMLLIDDGSPDRSGEICDEYAKKDKRVRVFHKENGGVSSARQCGMDNARGEYTIHVDSDDWVEPNMLEELYGKAKEEDADIVCCNYWEEHLNGSDVCEYSYMKETLDIVMRTYTNILNSSLWNKLIKNDLYLTNHIRFFEGVNMEEDLGMTLRLRALSKKTLIVPKALYHYNKQNIGSITSTRKIVYVEEQIKCVKLLEEWFVENFEATDSWKPLISNLKFLAKSSYFLYPDMQDIRKWKCVFPETNKNVWGYKQFSISSRIPMWLVLHGFNRLGKSLINARYLFSMLIKKIVT